MVMFTGQCVWLDLRGTFDAKVPPALKTRVAAKQKDILDGKFTVKVDDSQPKSTAK